MGLKIKGSGYYLPEKKVMNEDFISHIDTSDEWIKTRTGISSRYISEEENTSVLAFKAAKNAIEDANIDPKKIDLIVVATMTPDAFTPSTACILQGLLGLDDCKIMAFDINAACSGFVYALNICNSMLNSGLYKCALLVGSETLSKIIDFSDRSTCILFGDGAGAVILEKNDKESYFYSRSKPDVNKYLYSKGLGFSKDFNNSTIEDYYLKMNGQEVFKFACKAMCDGIKEMLEVSKKNIEDIDMIIPHQANLRIINNVKNKFNVDDKFYINLDKYGNTSAASIAIALAEGIEKNIIKKDMKIILVGFGAGLTWASAYLEL